MPVAKAERVKNNQVFFDKPVTPVKLPLKNTTAQVISKMMAVRMAVARSEFTSFNPAFAKIAVRAAKKAEARA